MFEPSNLSKLAASGDFTVWLYDANAQQVANAARNQLEFFPADCGVRLRDTVYIRDGGKLTHHWVDWNPTEKAFSLQLFG